MPAPTSPTPFYSDCTVLAIGCTLYTDITYTTTVPAGYYSDGSAGFCYMVDGDGIIINLANCLQLPKKNKK